MPNELESYALRTSRFIVSLLVISLDQWTKQWAVRTIPNYSALKVLPILNLVVHYNSGAGFSFLANAGGWQTWFFVAIACVVGFLVTVYMLRNIKKPLLFAWAMPFILGGAVGNLIDRIRWGYVIDFIQVHAGQWYWPTFNVADCAICFGSILIVLDMFVGEQDEDIASQS